VQEEGWGEGRVGRQGVLKQPSGWSPRTRPIRKKIHDGEGKFSVNPLMFENAATASGSIRAPEGKAKMEGELNTSEFKPARKYISIVRRVRKPVSCCVRGLTYYIGGDEWGKRGWGG